MRVSMTQRFALGLLASGMTSVADAFLLSTPTMASTMSVDQSMDGSNSNTYSNGNSLTRSMVGGRGWDNSDYLSNLSGDEEDREKATENYQDFSDRRKAFMKRQEDIMKTPQGRAFMEQQQERQMMMGGGGGENDGMGFGDEESDDLMNVPLGKEGGSRFSNMMAKAQRMKQMQQQQQQQQQQQGFGGGMLGFEQKFAPIDDEEDDGGFN